MAGENKNIASILPLLISDRADAMELARQGVKEIWSYGIAFWSKRMWME